MSVVRFLVEVSRDDWTVKYQVSGGSWLVSTPGSLTPFVRVLRLFSCVICCDPVCRIEISLGEPL